MKNYLIFFLLAFQCNFTTAQNLPASAEKFCAAREVFSPGKPDIIANFTGFTKFNSVCILNDNTLISYLLIRKALPAAANFNNAAGHLPGSSDACMRHHHHIIGKTPEQSHLRINKNIPQRSSRMGNAILTSTIITNTRS
ncbi:MAG: hypothetical protein WCO44_03485 [Bacteroidota bacterium]